MVALFSVLLVVVVVVVQRGLLTLVRRLPLELLACYLPWLRLHLAVLAEEQLRLLGALWERLEPLARF